MNEFERRLKESLTEVRDANRAGSPSRKAIAKQLLFRRIHRRRILQTTGGLALAGAAAVGAFVLFTNSSGVPLQEDPAVDAADTPPAAVAVVDVGDQPGDIAEGGLGFVWTANVGSNTVSRIDPATNQVIVEADVGAPPGDFAIGTGPVFVALPSEGAVVEVNAKNGRVVGDPIRVSAGSVDNIQISVGAGMLWAVVSGEGLVRVDIDSRDSVSFDVAASPIDAVVKSDVVAVLDTEGLIYQIDPATGEPIAEPLQVEPAADGEILLTNDSIWYFARDSQTVTRLDRTSGEVSGEFDPEGFVRDFVVDSGIGWALSRSSTSSDAESFLTPVDPETTEPLGDPILLKGDPTEALLTADSLWVTSTGQDRALRFSNQP